MLTEITTPVLTLNWLNLAATITFLITLSGFLWSVFVGYNKKLSKTVYYIDKKKRDEEIKEMKHELTNLVDCAEKRMTGTTGDLRSHVDQYHEMIQKQIEASNNAVQEKLDLVVKLVEASTKRKSA